MPADNMNKFYTILHSDEVDERNKYGSTLSQSTFHTKNQEVYSIRASLLRISHLQSHTSTEKVLFTNMDQPLNFIHQQYNTYIHK